MEQIKASAAALLADEYPDLPGDTVLTVVAECFGAAPPDHPKDVTAFRCVSLARARLDARRVGTRIIDLTRL